MSCRAQDGDRGGPAAGGGMPQETWARGPPEARDRDRDRDGGGFRGGAGGGGGFRPPPGRWAERRAAAEERGGGGGGGKDYGGGGGERGDGGGKGFARGDRGDREKDLEKWGKVCTCRFCVRALLHLGGGGGREVDTWCKDVGCCTSRGQEIRFSLRICVEGESNSSTESELRQRNTRKRLSSRSISAPYISTPPPSSEN